MCFPDEKITGNSGHTSHDVLYVAFKGEGAVPGVNGEDWYALDATTFERSLGEVGNMFVAGINVGSKEARSSESEEGDDVEEDGSGNEGQEEKSKGDNKVYGEVPGDNGDKCDAVDEEEKQGKEDNEDSDSDSEFGEEDFGECGGSQDDKDSEDEDVEDDGANDAPIKRTRLFPYRPPYGAGKVW